MDREQQEQEYPEVELVQEPEEVGEVDRYAHPFSRLSLRLIDGEQNAALEGNGFVDEKGRGTDENATASAIDGDAATLDVMEAAWQAGKAR